MTSLRISYPMSIEKTDDDGHVAWRIHPSRHTVDLALFDDRIEITIHDCSLSMPPPHLVELISRRRRGVIFGRRP